MSRGWQVKDLVQQLQQIYVLLNDGDTRALREAGLTPTQFTLLRCIDEDAASSLAISRLAEQLLCTRGNVTRLVRRLADLDLVSVSGDDNDQRLVLVSVTTEGARRLAHAREVLDEANGRRFHEIPRTQLRAMAELADTVAAALAKDLAGLDALGRGMSTGEE